MKNIEAKKEALVRGARIATSEQVSDNDFMQKVQKELDELKSEKLAKVTPRAER